MYLSIRPLFDLLLDPNEWLNIECFLISIPGQVIRRSLISFAILKVEQQTSKLNCAQNEEERNNGRSLLEEACKRYSNLCCGSRISLGVRGLFSH